MSQFSLDKLQQDLGAVPENERTPELQALLGFATTMEAAEEHLRTAAAARQAAGGAPSEALEPDVFKGLVKFVRAVALGAEAAGVGLCSAEVLTLLKESLLAPIITKDAEGKYEAHRPSVVCPKPTPTNIVQLLAAGVFLHVTGNPEPAIAMLSAALSGVWPPSRAMQRRLVARQFVPTAEAGTEAEAAASAQGGSASGAKDANSPPAAELGEAGGSSDKASASQPGEAGSSKAGEAAAPAATQKEVEVEAEELPPPLAQELEAALAQHCPDVSLAELQKAALALRLFLGCRAVGEQSADGPSFQAIVRTLLLDCQQLLDLDPTCMHAYVWAAQLVLYARWPLDGRRVVGLFEEGARRSLQHKCWLAAGEVQHDAATYRLRAAAGERNVAVRQALLLEAGRLLEAVEKVEGRLEPWMPPARLRQLSDRRTQLSGLMKQLQAGSLRPTGIAPPRPAGLGSCSFCGKLSPQLKTCHDCKAVAYCSRDCQVKDWKSGHKQWCAELSGKQVQAAEVAEGAEPTEAAKPAAVEQPAQAAATAGH